MILYHWTLRKNLRSVQREGISPAYSQGKVKQVWACSRHKLGWTLAHVASRHGVSPDDMILIRIETLRCNVRKTGWAGVYTCLMGYLPDILTFIGSMSDTLGGKVR